MYNYISMRRITLVRDGLELAQTSRSRRSGLVGALFGILAFCMLAVATAPAIVNAELIEKKPGYGIGGVQDTEMTTWQPPQPVMQDKLILGTGDTAALIRNYDLATQDMKQLGMSDVRLSVNWQSAQPNATQTPNFGQMPEISKKLRADGFTVTLLLWDPPEWTFTTACDVSDTLPSPTVWKKFLQQSLAVFDANVVQILNEPNILERNIREQSCRKQFRKRYAELVNLSAPLIRADGAKVMIGGLYRGAGNRGDKTSPFAFTDSLKKNNADFDILAIHPYPSNWVAWAGSASRRLGTVDLKNMKEWTDQIDSLWPANLAPAGSIDKTNKTLDGYCAEKLVLDSMQQLAQQAACEKKKPATSSKRKAPTASTVGKLKEVRITEMAYLTDTVPGTRANPKWLVSQERQADMVKQALTSVYANSRISGFNWFLIEDDHTWPGGLKLEPKQDRTKKLAFETWVNTVKTLQTNARKPAKTTTSSKKTNKKSTAKKSTTKKTTSKKTTKKSN